MLVILCVHGVHVCGLCICVSLLQEILIWQIQVQLEIVKQLKRGHQVICQLD